ncbi:MAG: carbamoyltransferase [Parafilimonas sp.]|nr:carbamoyltransferase [Parafilimonas sp.]
MFILGINAVFHDSSACIIHDGKLLAAAEEERFTHIKHGKRPIPFSTYELPFHAIDYCLKIAGIHINDVDHIAYSFNPYKLLGKHAKAEEISLPLKPNQTTKKDWDSEWDPLFLSLIVNAPGQLADGYPHHLQKRFVGATASPAKWHFIDHHIAHAASAFYPSPFERSAVMVLDGRGEKATSSYYIGEGNKLEMIGEVCMPHSLGLLYEDVTTHLGFLHSSDEYKVMALASYGKPVYLNAFRNMIHVDEDSGNYTIDKIDFEEVLGAKRFKNEPFEQEHFDIAHSLQKVLEETAVKLSNWLYKETQCENLCLAGGVALNCVMNAVIRDNTPFKNIWVQPAAGDAGTALGAALWVDINERKNAQRYEMHHVYWGPDFEDKEIEQFLQWTKVPYRKLENVAEETAKILAEDKVIGWYQGRMEFGPRALGSRSILASPVNASMQQKLNEIKDREDFRPVAPVVLEEDAGEWFEDAEYSPFMLFVYNVKEGKADKIPAVRHVDNTARIQTINRNQHPLYYDLLSEFKKQTGVPVLINTSFNTRGEPIVCTPRDAIECFWTSPFDALVINSFLLEK